mgnify:CR=1 FL=1
MAQSIGQKFTPVTLLKFALPSMVMMVLMSCYTITDGIFISRFLGDNALSAVNIVYPVINIVLVHRRHARNRRKRRRRKENGRRERR